jgi:ditrans,polycis-polyprenyl diphosphate synthase
MVFLSILDKSVAKLLAKGPIPKHVAFIMDGNRRFARLNNLSSSVEGHRKGSVKLQQVVHWSLCLGIQELSVYALSTDNFRRPREELDGLFALAQEVFAHFLQDASFVHQNRIRIVFAGKMEMLPLHLQQVAERLMESTRGYTGFLLNICCPYTSLEEVFAARNSDGNLCKLWVKSPVDLLVRTSGERRLSNFLLWQVTSAPQGIVSFTKQNWPAFSWWNFIYILLLYQVNKIYCF